MLADGALRGAMMGCGYAVAVVAQAVFIDTFGVLIPDPLKPYVSIGARWATAALTAVVGTGVAAGVYMVVWKKYRTRGWDGYEGGKVLFAGFLSYMLVAAVTLATRAVDVGFDADPVETLAGTPPLLTLIAVPVAAYGFVFSRACATYHTEGAMRCVNPAVAPQRR